LWIVAILYLILGLLDLWGTYLAISFGVQEANPIMVWAQTNGFFLTLKLSLTVFIAGGIAYLYHRKIKWVGYLAIIIMSLVLLHHFWGLYQLNK
jgi:hypothetical protein